MSALSPFFTNKDNILTPLSEGEKVIIIKHDFPNANLENVKFLADAGMIVLTHTPMKGFSTLSVERISKSIHFSPSDDIPGPFALPEKIITPKFIGKEADILSLCNSYHCINIDYKIDDTNSAKLKEYHITYNCIGWAFGMHDWINPILSPLETNNITLLENKIKGFLNLNLMKYQQTEKSHFLVYNVIKNIKTVLCGNNVTISEEINKDGTIAFYFKNHIMTHAARYVDTLEEQAINAWTSKLGHNIMIAHELNDLSGANSIYGDPFCYGLPELLTQTHFSGNISISGEIFN